MMQCFSADGEGDGVSPTGGRRFGEQEVEILSVDIVESTRLQKVRRNPSVKAQRIEGQSLAERIREHIRPYCSRSRRARRLHPSRGGWNLTEERKRRTKINFYKGIIDSIKMPTNLITFSMFLVLRQNYSMSTRHGLRIAVRCRRWSPLTLGESQNLSFP